MSTGSIRAAPCTYQIVETLKIVYLGRKCFKTLLFKNMSPMSQLHWPDCFGNVTGYCLTKFDPVHVPNWRPSGLTKGNLMFNDFPRCPWIPIRILFYWNWFSYKTLEITSAARLRQKRLKALNDFDMFAFWRALSFLDIVEEGGCCHQDFCNVPWSFVSFYFYTLGLCDRSAQPKRSE